MVQSAADTNTTRSGFLFASAAALVIQLVLQLVIGLLLSFHFSPLPASAHADAVRMHAEGITRFLQAMHYWGSAVLILHSLVHLAAMVWLGRYREGDRGAFLGSLIFIACAIGFQMTGNVLPFDRHGVQTAGIEASIAARTPVVGATMAKVMLGGDAFNDGTAPLWYTIHHYVLPVLAVVAVILLAGWLRRKDGVRGDWLRGLVPVAVVAILGIAVPSPLGSAATAADYTSFDARVSWYFWPLHGAMRAANGAISGGDWIGSVLLPGLFALFLAALFFAGKRIPEKAARGGLAVFAAVLLALGIFEGGSFAPLTGTRDPATTAVATGSGPTSAIDKALAEKGRTAFNNLACKDCHGVDGKVGSGGPALTNVWKKHSDAEYYMKFVKNPVAVNPNSTMPGFATLSNADLKAIAEFLRSPK